MRSTGRRVAAQLGATCAAIAVTFGTAAFAILVAVTWTTTLPAGALTDLSASPDAALTVRWTPHAATYAADVRTSTAKISDALAASGASQSFSTAVIAESGFLTLPGTAPDGPTPQVAVIASADLQKHSTIVAGSWPTAPSAATAAVGTADAPIPVAVPVTTAGAMHVRLGQTLTLRPATGAPVVVRIVGLVRRAPQNPAFWSFDPFGPSGTMSLGSFTTFDPFIADPSLLASGVLRGAAATMVLTPSLGPHETGAAAFSQLSGRIDTFRRALDSDAAHPFTVSGHLPSLLSGLARRVAAAQARLLAAALLLAVVGAATLSAVAGLLAGRGVSAAAVRRTRGAHRGHLIGVYTPELLALAGAAAAGVPAGQRLGHGSTPAAWPLAGLVGAVAVALVAVRLARPPRPAAAIAARGRQPALLTGLRAGTDLALAAGAAVALWHAESASPIAIGPGGVPGVDPVVAAGPALAVAAGAALAGRLVPGAARLAERFSDRARRLPVQFTLWQVARVPLGYVLPALVTLAAVADCTYAVADHASRARSLRDQAAYTTGAQVRVTSDEPFTVDQASALVRDPDVLASTPVVQSSVGDQTTLLALDAASAGSTVSVRPDLLGRSPDAVWPLLARHPSLGSPLPGTPSALTLDMTLGTVPAGAAQGAPFTVDVDATVRDATGLTRVLDLGSLPADGRSHALNAALSTTGQPAYPITVLQIGLAYTLPADNLQMAWTVSGFDGLSTWTAANASPKLSAVAANSDNPCGPDAVPPSVADRAAAAAADSGAAVRFSTGSGLYWEGWSTEPPGKPPIIVCQSHPARGRITVTAPGDAFPVPALATRAYLDSTGIGPGATALVTVSGVPVTVRIAAVADAFPTLPGDVPNGLVVDLPALADAMFAAQHEPLLPPPSLWWLRTRDGGVPAAVPAGAGAVTAAAETARLVADPLSAAPQRTLDLSVADLAGLAALGLAAALAGAGRGRTAHEEVLALIGAWRHQVTAIRAGLHSAIVVPAALLGVGLGVLVAHVVLPAQISAPDGSAPLPPVLLTMRPAIWLLAPALALVLALSAAIEMPRLGKPRNARADAEAS